MKFSINPLILLIAAVLSVNLLAASYDIQKIWDTKILAQRNINYQLNDAEEKWNSLENIRSSWDSLFMSESETDGSLYDLLKVLNMESSGLKPTLSKITDSSSSQMNYSGIEIGLSKICLKNTSTSFQVTAGSITELIDGLSTLNSRSEIIFKDFRIINKAGKPIAEVYDLCMLMRI